MRGRPCGPRSSDFRWHQLAIHRQGWHPASQGRANGKKRRPARRQRLQSVPQPPTTPAANAKRPVVPASGSSATKSAAQVLNHLKSELFTKQACRDARVVYSLCFSPTTCIFIYTYGGTAHLGIKCSMLW